MKNLLFALLALMVIIIASCSKKEEVIPQSVARPQPLVMTPLQRDVAIQMNLAKNLKLHSFVSKRKKRARTTALNDSMKVAVVQIVLAKDSTTNPIIRDGAVIGNDSTASTGYVAGEDAPHFPGFGAASLSTVSSDSVLLAVNIRPYKPYQRIPLYAVVKQTGNYLFFLDPRENTLPKKGGQLWLHDITAPNDSVRIDKEPHSFTIINQPEIDALPTRFSVSFCEKKFK